MSKHLTKSGFSRSQEHPAIVLYFVLVLHFSEGCGSVEKSDNVLGYYHTLPIVMNPLPLYTWFYTSQRCRSVEKSDNFRIS